MAAPSAPTVDAFTALALSSPRRWRTLRFTVTWRREGRTDTAVRAWLRRPGDLRVETLDGRVLDRQRAAHTSLPDDDPMYQDYRWVAMLNPRELGVVTDQGLPVAGTPVEHHGLGEVVHHGRRAWQAELVPGEHYDPRCSCCPLLFSRISEDIEADMGVEPVRAREPDLRYAEAHRVRLDVGTGVCVYTEELGGSFAGRGHDLTIEAVDEPMPHRLFD
ncbi:hypothetical protein FFT09_11190 [Saccharomonospora piscinae]|uniref:hypothetical protein n=1 Tax=Saccharomonospora piscinae TaxID=687388 RepID=UPI001106D987|nr:hypothetical protein [Saccharomonospora piscinae]TLW91514.1 hypothetical protein FFT09_11190 [Saccharomonospora piscinae]